MKKQTTLTLLTGLLLALPSRAAEIAALAPDAPWRVFLVCSQTGRNRNDPITYTPAPPAHWMQADFDDSGWGRYSSDLPEAVGGYGCGQSSSSKWLCLRTRFGVVDPATVRDLVLTLEYRGGVVVYINGQEMARAHLPTGKLELETPAEEYPAEVIDAVLPRTARPAEKNLEAYEKRIRKWSGTLPAALLRKGANTLVIELHAAPAGKLTQGWSAVGLSGCTLTSQSGVGVVSYADAIQGVTLWNATPMDTVAVKPGKYQSGFLWWASRSRRSD